MKRLLLSLLMIVLPFSELLRFQLLPSVHVRVLDVLVFVIFLFSIIRNLRKYLDKLAKHKELLVFVLALLASNLLFDRREFSHTAGGLLYLFRTVGYLLTIPLWQELIISAKQKRLFTFGLLFLVSTGLIQYLLYPDLRNLFYLGYDPHHYRLFGLFLDPNIIGLIFAWAFFYFKGLELKPVYKLLILGVTLLALLLTYSRISWLSFAAGITYLFFEKRRQWYMLFLIVFALIALLLPRYFGEGTNIFRTNSLVGKQKSFEVATLLLEKSPFIGIGFNNLNQVKNYVGKVPDNSRYGLDNSLLTVVVTTGIIGTLIFLVFWLSLWRGNNNARVYTLVYFVHLMSVNSFFLPSVFVYYFLFREITQRRS